MKNNSWAVVFVILFLSFEVAFANTIYIPRNYYPGLDHGNPAHEGSIASYFVQYGENNRYLLTTPSTEGSYGVYTSLTLPAGSSLESDIAGEGSAWVRAYAVLPQLLKISNNSFIENVVLDGNYMVNHVIKGDGVSDFRMEDSVARRTKNDNGNALVKAHVVAIQGSSNIRVVNSVITQAGDSGVDLGSTKTEATGLYLVSNIGVEVRDSDISYALSAGINTTNSKFVNIVNNRIDNTGRANKYNADFPADGITGYHNDLISPEENLYYTVLGNEITNWYNHGIHLSGRWIDIRNNSIHSPGLIEAAGHAIYVGDYRDRVECSSIIWIQDNYVKRSVLNPNDAADGIRVHHYKWEAYWPHGNTGDVGNSINVTDHRYNNLGNQLSCPLGFADQYYIVN